MLYGIAVWQVRLRTAISVKFTFYFAHTTQFTEFINTIRYDTKCYFDMRAKAEISQLNLPHGTNN